MEIERTTSTNRSHRVQVATLAIVLAAALALSTLLAAPASAAPATRPLTAAQQGVKNALNRDRRLQGLSILTTQADAQAKAQAWAERLASDGRLHHSTLSDGIRTRYCSLGENIGYGSSAAGVQTSYMASPTHRANILDRRWNGVGVGYAKRGSVVYTVQVFIKTC